MTSSAWWAHPGVPWSHTWMLNLPSHNLWSLAIGEGVMGSSIVARSCRALGAEKLPITRVVCSLVSISLPNKGLGHRDHQKLVGKYLSFPATKKCLGESFCNCFSCSTPNGTGLGGEGSGVGGQDRVGSPCVNQEILGPTCQSSCTLGSSPVMVICDRQAGWSGPLQSC